MGVLTSSEKFKKWLDKCPIKYDEIPETSDYDILTINFHSKDIYWYAKIKDHQYEINADGTETDIERYGKGNK